MDVEKEAYEQAIEVLNKVATKNGFYAGYPGYDAVWARDSMIISLGASVVKNLKFKQAFAKSLATLAKNQSKLGQIPNAVDKFSRRKPHVDYGSIDSTCWFVIGNYIYKDRYKDSSLLKKYHKHIKKAVTWLLYQDYGEKSMLVQQPTSDWQDCFPHKYGYTINTQALFYKVLKLTKMNKEASRIKKVTNSRDGLWFQEHFLPWRWKDHNKYHERGEWFDSLGNVLATIFDLATEPHKKKIFAHIKKKKIDQPYPLKAIFPPLTRKSNEWQDYFNDCGAKDPFSYLNGGIWTFIGGFYVVALVKNNRMREAKFQLKRLAQGNLKKDNYFAEWLHGKTGQPNGGANQGWNAAMYVLAYKSVKERKSLL
jgi:glycogen debranching enzyme